MTDESDWRVLVPVEVLEGETVPDSVIDLLTTRPVVVLGYHVLPEQTPPGQARLQFEDQAQATLDDLVADFRDSGATAESRLVFTHDEEQTLERVAAETGCEAILIPNPAPDVERLLLPLGGAVDVERVASFVATLIGGRDISLTLLHVTGDEDGRSEGQSMLDDAVGRLHEKGVPGDAISTEVTVSGFPIEAITSAAADHHAVVMGETEPSLRSLLFGEASEQVAARSLGPVVVVRRDRSDADAERPDP